jgi:predicted transcriptional regulator of viral defense system
MLMEPSTITINDKTLTPGEQRAYLVLAKNKVMSFSDISDSFHNNQTARATMLRLVRKGYALRPRKGFYIAVPPERASSGSYTADRYLLANAIVRPGGALAYHTALELHGVAQSYFNTAYAIATSPKKNFQYQDVEYVFMIPKKIFGLMNIMRSGIELSVTDRERTFLDCLRRLDYCGGPEEYIKSVQTFHMLDFKILREYLKQYNERSLYQKTGYMLSLLKDDFKPPEEFIWHLKRKRSASTYYLLPRIVPNMGRLDNEWNIIAPKNIEELMRFV